MTAHGTSGQATRAHNATSSARPQCPTVACSGSSNKPTRQTSPSRTDPDIRCQTQRPAVDKRDTIGLGAPVRRGGSRWRPPADQTEGESTLSRSGDGQGIRWPDIDEDISVEGMLHGTPAHRPRTSTGHPV